MNPASLQWVAAAILLCIVFVLLLGFLSTVRSDPPRIESHWGGFGGGLGGWRMSASLAYLLGAIAFSVVLIALVRPETPQDTTKQGGGQSARGGAMKAAEGDKPAAKTDGDKPKAEGGDKTKAEEGGKTGDSSAAGPKK